jgi:hypothetical protein
MGCHSAAESVTMTHIVKQPPKHYCLRPDDWGYGPKYQDWSRPQIGDIFQCDECGQMWAYTRNNWWRVLNYAGEAEWRKI